MLSISKTLESDYSYKYLKNTFILVDILKVQCTVHFFSLHPSFGNEKKKKQKKPYFRTMLLLLENMFSSYQFILFYNLHLNNYFKILEKYKNQKEKKT